MRHKSFIQIVICSFLRYQYNPFDHLCVVHSSAQDFNQNPYKLYIYWKLNSGASAREARQRSTMGKKNW